MSLARRLALTALTSLVGVSLASCGSPTGAGDAGGAVASVAIDPPSSTLVVGAAAPLTAVVQDASGRPASGVSIVWSVRDTSVASVSQAGVVTGRDVGSTQVAASVNGVSAVASITVRPAPVATVQVEPDTRALVLRQSASFTATPRDAGGRTLSGRPVTWTSSNGAVASVTPAGLVTANAVGAATITATIEGVSANATVTVSPVPVGSVTIAPSSATVTVGQTAALVPTVKDATGLIVTDRVVAWSSSDDHIATVSTGGVVRGIAPGAVVISATSEGVSGSAAVTVVSVAVGSVTVLPTSATVQLGATTTLTATVKDVTGAVATDRQVVWSTSNGSVASVSSTGEVTGKATGTATITASSGGRSGSATIAVVPVPAPVATLTLEPSSLTLAPGQTAPLTATPKAADGTALTGRTVTYASDNTAVARVSSTGVVTGVALGTATVTATSEGKSASATVTVQPAVSFVLVSPGLVLVRRGATVQLSAAAYDANSNRIFGRTVTWSSDDQTVATVDPNGLVTTKKAGTVLITATIDGKSDSAILSVTN